MSLDPLNTLWKALTEAGAEVDVGRARQGEIDAAYWAVTPSTQFYYESSGSTYRQGYEFLIRTVKWKILTIEAPEQGGKGSGKPSLWDVELRSAGQVTLESIPLNDTRKNDLAGDASQPGAKTKPSDSPSSTS